jgi:hypothetical protein
LILPDELLATDVAHKLLMCGEVVHEKSVIGKGEAAQLAAGEAARMLLLLLLQLLLLQLLLLQLLQLLLLSAQELNNHREPVLRLACSLLTAGHQKISIGMELPLLYGSE